MKTLDDEWYIVIKAYKLTVFEISINFFVWSYIACPRYSYIRVYRLYDIIIHLRHNNVLESMGKCCTEISLHIPLPFR